MSAFLELTRRARRIPVKPPLAGRCCLVTGGAGGIGWAIAVALAQRGATVEICDISPAQVNRARQEARAASWGPRITFTVGDVTRRAEVEKWIDQARQRMGRIDVLVNNAAFIRWRTVEDMTVEEAELTMATGYHATVYTTKSVLPLMRRQGGGHIVTMGSSAGRVYTGGASAAYAAVKAALEAYTETLRNELRGSGVSLTLVRPGAVCGTDFFREHVPSNALPRMADFLPRLTPSQVAISVVKAIVHRRPKVDIPASLSVVYLLYAALPGSVRWLTSLGGAARRDYGHLPVVTSEREDSDERM
ncbi:SDR family NAD(P)-dependent oxidoreductase [Streptomyces sp. NPDC019443]|uniref:SDR family NAD(P)-dependent oxidoreductase n=1 Tax=Streptomyces sp. NPDC019443 TaxID=3365061 RepID=UPI003799471F